MTAQLIHEGTEDRTTAKVAPADRGGPRGTWHRIRRTVQEMNYATRRVVELQAPWSVDKQWHRK